MRQILLPVLVAGLLFLGTLVHAEDEIIARPLLGVDGVQRVELLGGSYFFRPNRIIVKANVPVELSVRKESWFVPHNLVIKAPEAGIDVDVSLGTEPVVVRFTPTKAGSYTYSCTKQLLFFESHRDKGMHGILEVVE